MANCLTGKPLSWSEIRAQMAREGIYLIAGNLYEAGHGSCGGWPEELLTEEDAQDIEEGLSDLRAGRVVTDEEMREMVYG